jgi:hypothetical protein
MRQFRISSTVLLLITLIFISGCVKTTSECRGLQLGSMVSSIGAVDPERFDEQRMSYTIHLCNDSKQDSYISFVEPIITDDIKGRITSGDARIEVKEMVKPGGSIQLQGEFIFEAGDLNKQDIIAMEPIITGFRLGTEQVIQVRGAELD